MSDIFLGDAVTGQEINLTTLESDLAPFFSLEFNECSISVYEYPLVFSFIKERNLQIHPFYLRQEASKVYIRIEFVGESDIEMSSWKVVSFHRLNNLELMERLHNARTYLDAKVKRPKYA